MKIGVRDFTYGKFASGGEGAACVYTGGRMVKDRMVNVDYNVTRDSGRMDADDHPIARDNDITDVELSLELAQLDKEVAADILGWLRVGETNEYLEITSASPYVGIGFAVYEKDADDGTKLFRGVWLEKMQMGLESDSVRTKGKNIEYQTETISGNGLAVQTEAAEVTNGEYHFRRIMFDCATLAACETWLKGKAGIQS